MAWHCGAELCETRLPLQRTVCMSGREAAALFDGRRLFKHEGAVPTRIEAAVRHRWSGGRIAEVHGHRRRTFMSPTTPNRIDTLTMIAEASRASWTNTPAAGKGAGASCRTGSCRRVDRRVSGSGTAARSLLWRRCALPCISCRRNAIIGRRSGAINETAQEGARACRALRAGGAADRILHQLEGGFGGRKFAVRAGPHRAAGCYL